MIVILLTLVGLLVYEHFFPMTKAPVGVWVYSEDVSGTASSAMREWFGNANEDPSSGEFSLEEPVYVNVILRIGNDGTYEQSVEKGSYDAARDALYQSCAAELKKSISAHLEALGMTGDASLSDAEAEELINEAVSMGSVEYLTVAIPDIIPSYEEYVKKYGDKGNYSVGDHSLTLGSRSAAKLIFDGESLLLDDTLYKKLSEKETGNDELTN